MSDNTPRSETGKPDEQVNKAVSGDLFTPGPWHLRINRFLGLCFIHDNGDDNVHIVMGNTAVLDNCTKANATLVAAAPEMLEAIRETLTAFEKLKIHLDPNVFIPGMQTAINKMQKASQKATTITE